MDIIEMNDKIKLYPCCFGEFFPKEECCEQPNEHPECEYLDECVGVE